MPNIAMPPAYKWHSLSHINVETRTALCQVCGNVKIKHAGFRKNSTRIRWKCRNEKMKWERKKKFRKARYRRKLQPHCQRCGFVPLHIVQLDIHHKDENHRNNHPDNLETLCANCHRLESIPQFKTFLKPVRQPQFIPLSFPLQLPFGDRQISLF